MYLTTRHHVLALSTTPTSKAVTGDCLQHTEEVDSVLGKLLQILVDHFQRALKQSLHDSGYTINGLLLYTQTQYMYVCKYIHVCTLLMAFSCTRRHITCIFVSTYIPIVCTCRHITHMFVSTYLVVKLHTRMFVHTSSLSMMVVTVDSTSGSLAWGTLPR